MEPVEVALIGLPDATNETIALRFSACALSFSRLAQICSASYYPHSDQVTLSTIQDEFGRFRVWSGNIGAHRVGKVSLDHRLREASHMYKRVTDLLDELRSTLEELIDIVSGKRKPYDEESDSTSSSGSDSDNEGHVTANGSHQGGSTGPRTEIEQRLFDVSDIIACLYRLSVAFRNPTPTDRLAKSARIDVSHFAPWDIRHVSQKFPQADISIIRRLGEANTKRRQLLRYMEKHHSKLARNLPTFPMTEKPEGAPAADIANLPQTLAIKTGDEDKKASDVQSQPATVRTAPSALATTLNTQTTVATYVEKDGDYEIDDAVSETSSATSGSISDDGALRIPPAPKGALEGEPFECPYCYEMTTIRSMLSWKKHIFRDLQPYVCTFADCSRPNRMFASRHMWLNHENQVHRRQWVCNACQQVFSSKPELKAHLKQNHEDTFAEHQLPALLDMCERPIPVGTPQICPLCLQEGQVFNGHLARHLQSLALFTLPRKDSDSEDDVGSNDARVWNTDDDEDEDQRMEGVGGVDSGSDLSSAVMKKIPDQVDEKGDPSTQTEKAEHTQSEQQAFRGNAEEQPASFPPQLETETTTHDTSDQLQRATDELVPAGPTRLMTDDSMGSSGVGVYPLAHSLTGNVEDESTNRPSANTAGEVKALPFIRPSDIYKRMEEEREKDRRSQESPRPSLDLDINRTKASSTSAEVSAQPASRSQPISSPQPAFTGTTAGSRVRALFDFQRSEPGELQFRKGDVITVHELVYKDWPKGSLRGQTGIFPLNYVEKLPDPQSDELKLRLRAKPPGSVFDRLIDTPPTALPHLNEQQVTLELERLTIDLNHPIETLSWAEKALAWAEIARCYLDRCVGKDHDIPSSIITIETDAVNAVNFLAEEKFPKALFLRGMHHEFGKFGYQLDKQEAYRYYRLASEKGFARADYRLGMTWEDAGEALKALRCYRQAAAQKDSAGSYRLGMANLMGQLGQMQDEDEGLNLVSYSATCADLNAPQGAYILGMIQLGELHKELKLSAGRYTLDVEAGIANIEKAARLGFAKAQYRLGRLHELAKHGCEFNPAISLHYYHHAACQGDPEAEMGICKWFLCGYEGVFEKDEKIAWEYGRRAATSGLADGEFAVGYFYDVGIHVLSDLEQAKIWYRKAADKGHEDALTHLLALEPTPSLFSKDGHLAFPSADHARLNHDTRFYLNESDITPSADNDRRSFDPGKESIEAMRVESYVEEAKPSQSPPTTKKPVKRGARQRLSNMLSLRWGISEKRVTS